MVKARSAGKTVALVTVGAIFGSVLTIVIARKIIKDQIRSGLTGIILDILVPLVPSIQPIPAATKVIRYW